MKTAGKKHLQSLLSAALDFVFPLACCICERFDESVANGSTVCQQCETDLIPIESNICLCCSAPVGPYVNTDDGCQHCRAVKLKFGPVFRLGVYQDLMRLVCLRAKQSPDQSTMNGLARLLVQEHTQALTDLKPDIVLPVPQHWMQRMYRPANPAETIAQVIAAELNLPCATHILRKRRSTGTQKSLSVSERKQNVLDAFVVDYPAQISGQQVLLVDDVMTTGITANEISKTLRTAGARKVSLAVVARVLQD